MAMTDFVMALSASSTMVYWAGLLFNVGLRCARQCQQIIDQSGERF